MRTIHEGLQSIILDLRKKTLEAQKFDEGNAAAGRRLTIGIRASIKSLKELRRGVYQIKQSRKNRK